MSMQFADLEVVYDELVLALDQAGPDKELLLLTKLALVLADQVACIETFKEALHTAAQDINIEAKPLHAEGRR